MFGKVGRVVQMLMTVVVYPEVGLQPGAEF